MSPPSLSRLLSSLEQVEAERRARLADPVLGAWVTSLKAFQQGRFVRTYPDLLAHPRWSAAARFFVDELYGPADFTARDRGFARVVPALVRLFPSEVVETVERLLALHALSERLDTAMAAAVAGEEGAWEPERYGRAWRTVGRRVDREEQVAAVLAVGRRLDELTRQPGLRTSLRLMRLPAGVAGLGDLQGFLERGFDAFRAMGGATGFLQVVEAREAVWLAWLFDGRPLEASDPAWLGQFR